LQRHFARLGLPAFPEAGPPRVYGRFEAAEFGQLWTGDGLHGPKVAGRRAVLCAFVDDWSRSVPGWRWGSAEDTVRLEAALRRGLEVHGVPERCFVDNGSAFTSAPFNRTLAMLKIAIVHSRPGQPSSRGKVERFFRTVRTQFLVELEARGGAKDLAELNELFGAWLEGVYHRGRHSETGETPLARVMRGRALRRPSPAELREAFLWSASRTVDRRTASVAMFGNHYEVDPALAGTRVELVYDPFDLAEIEVRYQGRPMGKAVPRVIRRHTHPAARVAAEQARRIAYAGIGHDDGSVDSRGADASDDQHDIDEQKETSQ
jgi:putative transposase